jgi:hypothetical protein
MLYIISFLLPTLLNPSPFDYDRENCRCLEDNLSPWAAIDKATAVFSGQVVEIKQFNGIQAVRFEVDQLWKGIIEIEKIVNTPTNSCGWNFQLGESYLVYANGNEESLSTDLCTKTTEADDWKNLRFMPDDFRIPSKYQGKCNYGNLFDPTLGCNKRLHQICGCDGNTYSNICEAEKHGVFMHHSGPCKY